MAMINPGFGALSQNLELLNQYRLTLYLILAYSKI